jgi:SAM-dependent methyltransferase
MKDVKGTYTAFHERKNPEHIYPTEWVIRTLLGSYPNLSLDRSRYAGSRILDVGFGDGRNWPLLRNASFDVYGVEITEAIVSLGVERAESLGMTATLKVGTNSAIPFGDGYFDYILACHSCYYVDAGTKFEDNLREYHRVLKPEGILLASLPEAGHSIFNGCVELGEGHVEIRNDPWGLRNGYVMRRFHTEAEIERAFQPLFRPLSTGVCRDNYYGVDINSFLLVCRKSV